MKFGLMSSILAPLAQRIYPAGMKNILLIGGPKNLQGIDRIDDDLLSILSVEGLYDRKAVVVWPTSGFLNFPIDPDSLKPFVDMDKAALSVIRQRKLVSHDVLKHEIADELKAEVQADHEAIRHGIIGQALTEALLRLAKLILAVPGGQNMVAVVGNDAPVYAMCWTKFVKSWSASESKGSRNYKSHDAGYGVLNSVKSWPWAFKVNRVQIGKAGELIPKYPFLLYGYDVTISMDSLFDVLESHDAEIELSYPVTDRLGGARAIKVSGGKGYMLVVPEPDKLRNFIIGLKTAGSKKAETKGGEIGATKNKSSASSEKYMTRKEVADELRCTPRTVDRHLKAGKLTSVKAEGKVLILKSSVDELLER